MTVLTLAERKKARAQQMREAFARLRHELAAYGRQHGGRFWVYGSAAADKLRYDSDIDILVDFEAGALPAAVSFAETACVRHDLKPDVRAKSSCTPAFIERIATQALLTP